MEIYSLAQQDIATQLEHKKIGVSKWKDWRWQLKHCVTRVDSFEALLGISLTPNEKRKIEMTMRK
ncbi:MAG: lysine 2,3-aminomutase, partial [Desulfuromonadaceae bacterium]|nr:lysine 2,3-aminomutase [Desulfuromonadaceae bacterium]